jgi:hypothetical protein
MIEAKFHLFQIEEKMGSAHSIVAPEFRLGKAPEILDTVHVTRDRVGAPILSHHGTYESRYTDRPRTREAVTK